MFLRVLQRLRSFAEFLRSHFQRLVLDRSRHGDLPPVRVVMLNGRKRLDAPTVNYSFGTLHTILAEALVRSGVLAARPDSVLLLGLGAGSLVELLRREHGCTAPIVGVEIDPEVLRLGRQHFGLGEWPGLEIVQADARTFVGIDERRFSLVVVDLFLDSVVPPACREEPFLGHLCERLAPGGKLLFNVVADTVEGRTAATLLERELRARFGTVDAMPIRSNVVFAATAGGNAASH